MTRARRWFLAALLAPGLAAATAAAAPPLRVGVAEGPPFAIRNADGTWSGIAVDLWSRVADALDLAWVTAERPPADLVSGLQDGSLDVVVGPLSVTPRRAEVADFTQPYLASTLAIAVQPESSVGWSRILRIVFAPRLLHVLAAMAAVGVVLGALVWLFEHRGNPGHFESHVRRGLWSAVWWAATTLTTVGYGDKTPRTVPGRLVAILGMVAGILLASVLTATFAGEIAVANLRSTIRGRDDLRRARVGTVAGSAAENWLRRHEISARGYPDVQAALGALEGRQVDAVVYHDVVLRYRASAGIPGEVDVLPVALEQEYFGFALPAGSALLGRVNLALLRATQTDRWERLVRSYLGTP